MNNTKIKAYYQDQISFYKTRMKRAQKNIAEQQSFVDMGMAEIDPMYQAVYDTEKEVMELFEKKLKELK